MTHAHDCGSANRANRLLDEWCRREGVSRAEAVRRAVPDDGATYQERLRCEWDERNTGKDVKALFDTHILIDYLKGVEAAQVELARYRQSLISIVTWMEVVAGVRNEEEGDVIEMFLRDFRIVEVTRAIAKEATDMRKTARLRLPDALIWASARHESALLATRNTKDFPKDESGIRIPY